MSEKKQLSLLDNKLLDKQEAVIAYIEKRLGVGVGQNQLAAQLGISPAHLINVKKGDWEKVSVDVLNKLYAQAKPDKHWQVLNTTNFKTIQELCEDSMKKCLFQAVSGYTGGGKTTAFRYFSDSQSSVAYVLADVLMSQKSFLASICRALGMAIDGTKEYMMKHIVDRLIAVENSLLVIDDAGKLNDHCFRLLQIIYDRTEGQSGIVIGGTERLKEYIDKGAARNKLGYRELKRRIVYWQSLYRPKPKEVETLAKLYDITDKAAVKYLQSTGSDYGTLRNFILNALSVTTGPEVTREVLSGLHLGDEDFVYS